MGDTIRLRARVIDGVAIVKTLIRHPMETGERKDKKTGDTIAAHYIQKVHAEHGGRTVFTALWGRGISKNPYLSFKFKGARPGDKLEVGWVDNEGQSDSLVTKIR